MAATGAYARYTEQDEPGLYLVYPQDERTPCTCDIFILHGLHGGATKTWRHPETGNIWFRDLLPDLIRTEGQGANARIWTYGYPASVAFQTSTIYDFAQALLNRVKDVRKDNNDRKIVWICHSLGGLVLKQALIEAKINPRFVSISSNTVGIIFLGTPHRGSDVANLGTVVATIVSSAMPGIRIFNRDVLRDLKSNNHTLFGISSQFSNICSTMTIHSFHETMPLGTTVIVDQTSAIMHLENERKRHGLYANHREMCRFRDGLDQNWFAVGSSVVELVVLSIPGRYREPPNISRQASQTARRAPYPMSSNNPYAQRQPPVDFPIMPAGTYPRPSERPNPQITRVPVPQANARPVSSYTPQPAQRSPTPTHAPPLLPPGWVAQWDLESGKYFYVERATGVVEWEPPQRNQPQPGPSRQEPGRNDRLDVPGSNHQRSASAGSAPPRMPYPPLNKAQSRENFQPSRPQPAATASTPAYPAHQAQPPPRPPPPQASATAAPQAQPHRIELDPDDPSLTRESALCDACMCGIKCSEPRVQCTVCYDYDLCIPCFQAGKETKNHKRTHKLSHILNTALLQTDDLIPVKETINPEFSVDRTQRMWSITEFAVDPENSKATKTIRFQHLYSDDSHARFLTSVRPGHYAISVIILMKVADIIDEAGKKQLSESGAGFLRVSIGTVKVKKDFFSADLGKEDQFKSTTLTKDCLPHKLLNHYWWDVITIDVNRPHLHIQSDALLNVEGDESGALTDLGLILQWSECHSFSNSKEPVVSVGVDHIRLDNLLDYNEPHIRAPVPATPKPAPAPAPAQPTPAPAEAEEEDLSESDIFQALLTMIQQAATQAERNALQARLVEQYRQEEAAKQELIGRIWLQAMAQAVEEQERQEQAQRERERAARMEALRVELARQERERQQQQAEQALQEVFVEAYLDQYMKNLGLR